MPDSADVPGIVYRGGSATHANLTPRPDRDPDGLSVTSILTDAGESGAKAQAIDTGRLGESLQLLETPPPEGHCSISPTTESVDAWAATRAQGSHPLTDLVRDAIIEVVRIP